jgi:hypothetical protein
METFPLGARLAQIHSQKYADVRVPSGMCIWNCLSQKRSHRWDRERLRVKVYLWLHQYHVRYDRLQIVQIILSRIYVMLHAQWCTWIIIEYWLLYCWHEVTAWQEEYILQWGCDCMTYRVTYLASLMNETKFSILPTNEDTKYLKLMKCNAMWN